MTRTCRANRLWSGLSLLFSLTVIACAGSKGDERVDADIPPWSLPLAGDAAKPAGPFDAGSALTTGMNAGTSTDFGTNTGRSGAAGLDANSTEAGRADAETISDAATSDAAFALDHFDPNQVYLIGMLLGGTCSFGAIAPVLEPNRAAAGLDCHVNPVSAVIRPSDGRLLYETNFQSGVRIFHCDGCPATPSVAAYPQKPESNDEILHPNCSIDAGSVNSTGLSVLPDGGILQYCGTNWVNEAGDEVARVTVLRILRFGYANTALRADGILDLPTGQLRAWVGLPARAFLTYRVRSDGYWIVVNAIDSTHEPELWQAAFDGTAALVGTYPALPANQGSGGMYALDGNGRLYQSAFGPLGLGTTTAYDTIVRRSVQGESMVVYDLATNPLVRAPGWDLVTGP